MNVSDQIAELLKKRAQKVAGLEEFQKATETDGRLFSEEEQKGFDTLLHDVEAIDGQVSRYRQAEEVLARAARPVVGGSASVFVPPPRQLSKGIGFARMVQIIMASRGQDMLGIEMAKAHFPDMPEMSQIFRARALGLLGINKAAMAPATTTDATWAGTLVYANQLSGELIELVRAQAILGKLPSLRNVPFNVRIPRETAVIGTAGWVGQGAPKPVGKGAYDFVTIPFAKAALIVLLTQELAKFSNPSAEALMRDGLVRAVADFLDLQFISNAAAVANVSPAGILNGLPAGQTFASSGNGIINMTYDVAHAMTLLSVGTGARAPAWLMHPQNALALGFAQNAYGAPAFPGASGGTLAGAPVVTSTAIPANNIILIDQDGILHAEEGGIEVDVSSEASVQTDSAPDNPPLATTVMVSLWQNNLIGLRAEKYEYWMRATDKAVVSITGVAYGTVAPAPQVGQQPELALPPSKEAQQQQPNGKR